MVQLVGLEPNELHRFERLETIWNQARKDICDSGAFPCKDRLRPSRSQVGHLERPHAGRSGRYQNCEGERRERPFHGRALQQAPQYGLAVHEGRFITVELC